MEISEKEALGCHNFCMGRANRGGRGGAALRGAAPVTEAPDPSPLAHRCKTDEQRAVLGAAYSIGTSSTKEPIYISELDLQERLADQMDAADLKRVCQELENGPIPLLKIERDSAGQTLGIRSVTEREYDQRKAANYWSPNGYAGELKRIEMRDQAALRAVRTPEEKQVVEAMVGRRRMDQGHPQNFWKRAELISELGIQKENLDPALAALTEKGVLQETPSPDGSGNIYALRVYETATYPESPLGQHRKYQEEFGEDKYRRRMSEIEQAQFEKRILIDNEEERAVMTYVGRDSPYLDDPDKFVSASKISEVMGHVQSPPETFALLDRMVARGMLQSREGQRGGREYWILGDG